MNFRPPSGPKVRMVKAIYNPIPNKSAYDQETLVYNLKDGFSWVRSDRNNDWHCYNPTAVGAELEAIKAGFQPTAVTYLRGP